jgi:geranylgeranyl transferase type-1 subunit beta
VCGLDLLDALTDEKKAKIINFVYRNQVPSVAANNCATDEPKQHSNLLKFLFFFFKVRGGFRGVNFGANTDASTTHPHDYPHLIMTQCALQILLTCGDDLSRIDRAGIVASVKRLQQADGSFAAFEAEDAAPERDIRFSYCAAVISFVLDDWSGVDRDAAERHILQSQSHEGGFGQAPGIEAHAGSTFCAVAALHLMGRPLSGAAKQRCIAWCAQRQGSGFQGRPNKPEDSCYSFWTGGTISLLGAYDVVDTNRLCAFVAGCQYHMGGVAKWPNTHPDALHTFLSLLGVALTRQVPELQPACAALAISERAAQRLNQVYNRTLIATRDQ